MTGKEKSDLVLRLQFDFINNAFCDVVTKKYYRKYKDTRPFAANPDSNKYKLVDSVQQAALGQGVLKYTDAYRYALGYVTECKAIKEAISKRFKYLFVDEMQDCQQIQIDLLEQLFDKNRLLYSALVIHTKQYMMKVGLKDYGRSEGQCLLCQV